jgi:hypothetical protein
LADEEAARSRLKRAAFDRMRGHVPASSTVEGPVLWIVVIVGAIIAVTLVSMSSLRVWLSAARRSKDRLRAPPGD